VHRRAIVSGFAVVVAVLQLAAETRAQPKPNVPPPPRKGGEIYVVMKARLYEVDDAFYKTLVKARWRSRADLEELELQPQKPLPAAESLVPLLEKQKPVLAGKEINIDPGKEGALLTSTRAVHFLPTPDQLRQGRKDPQTVHEGVSLRAQVHISADRRFVRAGFTEKSLEIEGVEKVNVSVDARETEAVGEIVFPKEASSSQIRDIPDGGSLLLPLQYRPRAAREKDRWLVVKVEPRIYVEDEEKVRRGKGPN
jgi:hypothetical protein